MSNQKLKFNEMLSRREWTAVTVFFSAFFLFAIALYTYPFSSSKNSQQRFVIRQGETLGSISARLKSNGVIKSEFLFKLFAYASGNPRALQAGRYTLDKSNSYYSLIGKFSTGDGDKLVKVDLYGGISNTGIFNRLRSLGLLTDDSLIILTKDRKFLRELGFTKDNLLGYLMPGDVSIYSNSTSREVIFQLFGRFNTLFSDPLKEAAKNSGYSVHQLITLASIVDGETNRKEEMKTIAGVYLNRLKIGMKLQADPTVQFLLPDGWRRLSGRDLAIDSPYNTYMYYGIPPGPINNPGKDAILAVIYPEKHNYLFFVSDSTGKHNFSRTFAEHSRLARQLHIWLNSKD